MLAVWSINMEGIGDCASHRRRKSRMFLRWRGDSGPNLDRSDTLDGVAPSAVCPCFHHDVPGCVVVGSIVWGRGLPMLGTTRPESVMLLQGYT